MEEAPFNAEFDLLDPEVVAQLIELLETIDAPVSRELPTSPDAVDLSQHPLRVQENDAVPDWSGGVATG